MANVYVRSGAVGTANGTSWANAYLTLALAFTGSAAGDDFWISEDHSEQLGVVNTLLCPGTITAPCRIICVNHAGSVPPVSADLATTAVIGTTGAFNLTFTSSTTANYFYAYGIIWKTGSGSSIGNQVWAVNKVTFENCSFQLNSTAATSAHMIGTGTGAADITFMNCTWVFGASGQALNGRGGKVKFIGGSVAATGTLPTNVIAQTSGTFTTTNFLFDSVDLSTLTGKAIIAGTATASIIQLVNCKLAASYILGTVPTGNQITSLIISDNGSANTNQQILMYGGTLTTELTNVRSGGASDGTTPISWKIASNGNNKRQIPIETFQIVVPNALTGSRTASIEIANNTSALTTADIWVELEYLGTSGFPIGTFLSSGIVDPLAAGVTITSSSATWGGTLSNKQTISFAVTPSLAGLIRATVKIAKASFTLYIDPVITVV